MTGQRYTDLRASRSPRRRNAAPRRRLRFYLIVLLLYALPLAGAQLFWGVSSSGAQSQRSPSGDTTAATGVYRVTAGSSSLKEIDGERVLALSNGDTIIHEDVTVTSREGLHYIDRGVTFLVGQVKINQGTITMWGDEGEYRKLEDLAILRRNIRIVDEGWEVTCDEASYWRTLEQAWLTGNVTARDSTTTLYADSLFYDKNEATVEVFGNVRITNPEEGFTAEGEHGFYYRDTGEGVIDRSPRLIVEPDSPEPVTIVSDTMRVYPDEKHAIAYYTVKILKGNTVTQCDSAVLYDNLNLAELYGNPLAKQERALMKGDMMTIHYDEEEVNRIDVNGSAEMREEQTDTMVVGRDNWIKGDTISLYLHENRMDSIGVVHNAVSEYYPTAPNKIESNFVRGDSMFFRFDADSLAYVRITGSADGVYKFLDLGKGETPDSLRAQSDTNLTYVSFRDKAQKVVYSARQIEYFADTKDLLLKDGAKITYGNSTLYGDEVRYLSSMQLLDARGNPKLVDAGQEFFGRRMDYDLESEAGIVSHGSTRFEQGFYNGENVAKVGENEMKVWNSRYTTCDLKVPHYHIKAKYMKVYVGDQAVSGSTVLYVGETPVFYLPFIANSIRRGRRSGFLRPDFEFGITKQTGRYIRNVGYYWATNDYTDFTFVFDFNEDRAIRTSLLNQYKLRYQFDGRVVGNFYRDLSQNTNEWQIDATHKHNLGEKFKLSSDLHFISSDQAPKSIYRIDDVERVVERSLRSNIAVSKSWDIVGLSLSATRTQNLNIVDPGAVRVSTVFPNVSLSIPQRDLFFGERHRESEQGFWERILRGVKYSPGLSGRRTTEERVLDAGQDAYRSTEVISSRQSLGFQSPQKIGFVTLSPTLSASNTYTRTTTDADGYWDIDYDLGDTLSFVPATRGVEDKNDFSWNFGANSSTNFYGTFYPRIGRLRGVRHVISPVASYSFRPKIGNQPRAQRFNVRLTNSFDLKLLQKKRVGGPAAGSEVVTRTPGTRTGAVPPTVVETAVADTTAPAEAEEENLEKISGFLIWALSSSYDPEASKDKGWSNVSSTVNLRVFGTTLSMNQTIQPYDRQVLSTSIQTRFTLNGSHPFGRSEAIKVEELNVVAAADTTLRREDESPPVQYDEMGAPAGGVGQLALEEGRLPWSLSFGVSYSKTLHNDPRATVDMTGQFDLTSNWRFTYWASYDVQNREVMGQNFAVHRDLHCWEMSLSRQMLGDEWQFYFRINLKAHPELYGETGQRGLGGFASGLPSGSFMR
jgi:lipopolysaccharide assembly outer membrane protein LptD (OstA)